MSISPNIISICLIGTGLLAWSLAARPLVEDPDLDVPLNPLGINRSPYGEVFAMAMQSPIESYFHAGMGEESHQHAPGEQCTDKCTTPKEEKHVHDENCEHGHSEEDHAGHEESKEARSLHSQLLSLIESMNEVSYLRTNPKAPNESLMRHHRREAEDKLRFAYEMDPSHYGNYNSLHFFLTEPQIGTRPQLTPSAVKLAEETINYCLKQENDPRPALTAAAACTNILDLMFTDYNHNESSTFSIEQMRQGLNLLNYCLKRYDTLAKKWDESKNWELLSPLRVTECESRYRFISRIRDDAAKTFVRIENEARSPQ
ncbi:MAG: hypothetical protein V4727_11820 [Verrucomicrobiota bacterium]